MNFKEFESRKKDHLELSLRAENQASGQSGLDFFVLEHDSLPNLNFDEVETSSVVFNKKLKTPFFISSMTAGHKEAINLNVMMAEACQQYGWMMGVGSQRRELSGENKLKEWKELRRSAPHALLLANIGASQLYGLKISQLEKLVEVIEASALCIHLNVLQECLQPEGTPQFKGSWEAIEKICKQLSVPVIIKETGCGMSTKTLKLLKNLGVRYVDVSGLGGTHWGRIEGQRAEHSALQSVAAKTFQDWGVSTVQSVTNGIKIKGIQVWASGGVRSGLDAAKLIVMGATHVGFAKPALENAMKGRESLCKWMEQMEFELKVAMMCTGSQSLKNLKKTNLMRRLI